MGWMLSVFGEENFLQKIEDAVRNIDTSGTVHIKLFWERNAVCASISPNQTFFEINVCLKHMS